MNIHRWWSASASSTGDDEESKQNEIERSLLQTQDAEDETDADAREHDDISFSSHLRRRQRRRSVMEPHATEDVSKSVYLFAACASFNSCILGYDFGVNSLSVKLVKDALNLSDLQVSGYLGALEGFAMLGAATASFINDRFGRRGCFVMTSIGFLIGDLLQGSAQNYVQLMFGRSILGLAIGWGLAIDPMYISEISPSERRGFLVSWSEIAINVGIIFGFASGLVFYNTPDEYAWRYMYATGAFLPLIMFFFIKCFMPESPRWLLQKNRDDDAKEVLTKLCSGNEEEAAVVARDIKESIEKEEAAFQLGWKFLLCHPTPGYRRMLLAGIVAGISQQVVGISAISTCQIFLLDQSGVHDRHWQALTLVLIQIGKSVVTFGSSYLIDSWGRRSLSFISIAGILVALIVLAVDFHGSSSATSWVAILGLSLYMVSFAAGMGPVAWLVPSEVFSTSIRAKGTSITTFCNRAVSTIMAFSFLQLANAATWSGAFSVLIVLSILMAILIYFLMPETTGRSLEDMAVYFATLTGDMTVLDNLQTEHTSSSDDEESRSSKRTASTTITSQDVVT